MLSDMNQSFWLSATDLAQTGSFVWLSTGHKVRYHKWHRRSDFWQPSNSLYGGEVEHCMTLHHAYGHEMNDDICSSDLSYICDDRNKSKQRTNTLKLRLNNASLGETSIENWLACLSWSKYFSLLHFNTIRLTFFTYY